MLPFCQASHSRPPPDKEGRGEGIRGGGGEQGNWRSPLLPFRPGRGNGWRGKGCVIAKSARNLVCRHLWRTVRVTSCSRARPLDSTSKAKKLSNFLTRGGEDASAREPACLLPLPKMRAGADERPPRIVGEHFDAEEVNLKTNSDRIRHLTYFPLHGQA